MPRTSARSTSARKPTSKIRKKLKPTPAARSSSRRRATRDATTTPTATESAAPADQLPLPRIPRRRTPATTPAQRRAGRNLLDAFGEEQMIETLRLSDHKSAHRLADLMGAREHSPTSFYLQLQQAGFKGLGDLTDVLMDVRNADVMVRLLTAGPEVAESILSRATDQIQPHNACLASGHLLVQDPETGEMQQTEYECFQCQGTGYMLVSAEREWVELYLELVKMRKNQPINDFSRKVLQQNLNVYGDLAVPDGAPSIDAILARADRQEVALPAAHAPQLTDGRDRMPDFVGSMMPEDDVVEAVAVEG